MDIISSLGPLAALAGNWEGDKGDDRSPDVNRNEGKNKFREEMVFEPMGPVFNHEQDLFGLRYRRIAWRIGEKDPFHEDQGYWLWDAREKQVMRCFTVPRGITILAGGTVDPKAKSFELTADVADPVYGICSNAFLDREFKTVHYVLNVSIFQDGSFSYDEDSQIRMKGSTEIFHHRDKNTLRRSQ